MLNESEIIEILKSHFPQCIGDDVAVFPFLDELSYVISKDVLVEGVHFCRSYFDAESLACKALQVNLSDLAAKGALPKYVLLGLSLPELANSFLKEFLDFFSQQCKQNKVILIGGDTTKSESNLFISVTVIGIVKHHQIKWRHQALDGDVIAVAGDLGFAHLGWKLLENHIADYDVFKQACLRPRARLAEGQWCAEQKNIHACMDLSDGLLIDAEKMALASNLAAHINVQADVPDALFIEACQTIQSKPHVLKIVGGEDYGLLLSIDANDFLNVSQTFQNKFGYTLKKIGMMKQGSGIHLFPDSLILPGELKPFTHFGS